MDKFETIQKKFYDPDKLELLVEGINLYMKCVYHGKHNVPTSEENSRMEQIQNQLGAPLEQLVEVARRARVTLEKLRVQGVDIYYDTPPEQQQS